jgi:hypothetical protein
VYEVLAGPASYENWWPRMTCRMTGERGLEVILAGFGKLGVRVVRARHPDSLVLALADDRTEATLEWLLQPFREGSIVNVLLGLQRARGLNRRRELAYRSAVREGLVALKQRLEARPTV